MVKVTLKDPQAFQATLKQMGITPVELAATARVTPATLNTIQKRKGITMRPALKIVAVLGHSFDDLFTIVHGNGRMTVDGGKTEAQTNMERNAKQKTTKAGAK